LRIIAGTYKGRRLFAPKGVAVRPTADRVKEAVFSALGQAVTGARVLDLFAGSGGLGLEALSRGAARVVFVDRDPAVLAVLRRNLDLIPEDRAPVRVIRADLAKSWKPLAGAGPFDLVFMDPPYRQGLVGPALDRLVQEGLVAPDALAVAEHHRSDHPELPQAWEIQAVKTYGHTAVSFLSPAG
jgi:16S rRNA (guanine966-N2)-methyltransferase